MARIACSVFFRFLFKCVRISRVSLSLSLPSPPLYFFCTANENKKRINHERLMNARLEIGDIVYIRLKMCCCFSTLLRSTYRVLEKFTKKQSRYDTSATQTTTISNNAYRASHYVCSP